MINEGQDGLISRREGIISVCTQVLTVDAGKQVFAQCEDPLVRERIGETVSRAE